MIEAVLDYAAAQNITHIVVGRTQAKRWWHGRRFSEALTAKASAFTLHFVPVPAASPAAPAAAAGEIRGRALYRRLGAARRRHAVAAWPA